MSARLINLENQEATPLSAVAFLGRKKECTFFLPDQRVSRQHAMIRLQGVDEYWFTDLGSFNGSRINGQRVTTSRRLQNGDVIHVMDFAFRFELAVTTTTARMDETLSDVTLVALHSLSVIMLVSDLKGFTGLSEQLPPDDLAQVIGGWYKACNQIMETQGATIDKFIGDAVFAYWLQTPEARGQAMEAARRLQAACAPLQEQHRSALEPRGLRVAAGVGIHAGPVTVSPVSVGVQTILGDAVNVTFRLEALSRELGRDLLLTEEVIKDSASRPTGLEDHGEFKVKGRSAPLRVYSFV